MLETNLCDERKQFNKVKLCLFEELIEYPQIPLDLCINQLSGIDVGQKKRNFPQITKNAQSVFTR